MRALKYIVAVAALVAASAHAACGFPYYPEFADVFGRYDEVTPAMAAAVGAHSCAPLPGGSGRG
jgi:hypothetical protein